MISLSSTGKTAPEDETAAAESISPKRRIRIYRFLLTLVTLLVSLAIAEGVLRLVEKAQLGDRAIEDKLISDPILGLKLAPHSLGHDANGFRNDAVPQQADVVVLGDSQTWGVNAERQDAWPQQLSKLSGRGIYNMGMGGFGPAQYKALLPQALRLSPKIIVVGFYFGNDIYDAYHMAYQYEAHRDLRSSAAGDLSVDTVSDKTNAFWNEQKEFHATFGRTSLAGLSFWLREHLAIGRLLNRTHLWPGAQDVDYEIDKHWAIAHPDRGAVWDWPGQETVFTTAYRLAGLDLDEPRIAEGLRISQELLSQMQIETEANHTKLIVLLLPTKETVYARAQASKLKLDPTYQKLVDMEARIRAAIILNCQNKHISYVDALPKLTAALDHGERLYPTTTESHPNPRGYFVIASAVKENLSRLD
jgi:lysophospholipase L1-like esterase